MMRVGLDLTPAHLGLAGVTRYTLALAQALSRRSDLALEIFRHAEETPATTAQRIRLGLGRELAYYPFLLGRRSRGRVDLVHCPGHFAPRVAVPLVLSIQDAFHWRQPELFTRRGRWYHHHLVEPAARRAARVVTGSEYSKREIVELVGVDPARISVVPYGIEPHFHPGEASPEWLEERFGVTGPVVLCVGTLEPRKNIRAAIDAVSLLAKRGVQTTLIVAGAEGWGLGPLREAVDRSGARVVLAGRVSDEDLVRLYRSATVFLFPSLYEGFGFPALEAMACGCPTVVSNRGSLPEIAGEAARLVEPTDPEAIADVLAEVVDDPAHASDLRARGLAHSAGFDWARCAELHVGVYRAALEEAAA